MTIFKRGIIFSALFLFSFLTISAKDSSSNEELNNISSKKSYKYSKNEQVEELLTFAFSHLHTSYCGGGKGPNCFDCSGFTGYVFNHFGYKLESNSGSQTKNGETVSEQDLLPGDLVFYKGHNSHASRIGHVGIVVSVNDDGTFTFIHAASTGISHDNSSANYYAKRYVTARRIIEDNTYIHPKSIEIEPVIDTIVIVPDTIPTEKTTTIKVKKGQSLYSLSKEYACTIEQLKEWNQLSKNSLYIGQKLEIKGKSKDEAKTVEIAEDTKKEITHIVEKGETLYQLAKDYKCTIDDIINWNNLESSNIQPKQKLIIKTSKSKKSTARSKYHTVKAGETLSNIAENNNCTIKELKRANNLRTSRINIGQKIKMPQD